MWFVALGFEAFKPQKQALERERSRTRMSVTTKNRIIKREREGSGI